MHHPEKNCASVTPEQCEEEQALALNLAIIWGGLSLLALVWLSYGVVHFWQSRSNPEQQLCEAFPHKCPADSPYTAAPDQG